VCGCVQKNAMIVSTSPYGLNQQDIFDFISKSVQTQESFIPLLPYLKCHSFVIDTGIYRTGVVQLFFKNKTKRDLALPIIKKWAGNHKSSALRNASIMEKNDPTPLIHSFGKTPFLKIRRDFNGRLDTFEPHTSYTSQDIDRQKKL